jgi:cystathionine beta-synthase
MAIALQVAKDLREDQKCVVILPDNIRNYLTKFAVDNWLEARNLKESINAYGHPWWNKKILEMINEIDLSTAQFSLPPSTPCRDVINVSIQIMFNFDLLIIILYKNMFFQQLRAKNVEYIPIIDDDKKLKGIATTNHLLNKVLDLSLNLSDPIEKALFKKFIKIDYDATVGKLSRILEKESFVVVADNVAVENAKGDHKQNLTYSSSDISGFFLIF